MNNEKILEVLNEIFKHVWDWDWGEENVHPHYVIELRQSVALLIDYYESFKTIEGHDCHPDAIECCGDCLELNGYDVLGDELENEDSI